MALTDLNAPAPSFDPARLTHIFRDSDVPHQALGRLPGLYGEAGRNLHLSQFLARSPQVCIALMLSGAGLLAWSAAGAGGGGLRADFAWVILVLIGIVAMTRNYIRGFARSLRRVPLLEAASDLRTLLLYTGAAWGIGAFLVMPGLPAPALVVGFAILPSLACALLLKDDKGVIAFTAPACLTTASAAMLGAWPLDGWVAGVTLVAGLAICGFSMLHCAMRRRRLVTPR